LTRRSNDMGSTGTFWHSAKIGKNPDSVKTLS
jgi:hypothetical protein